jgi:Zn-dependent M28 family amino/carboxypeptidase
MNRIVGPRSVADTVQKQVVLKLIDSISKVSNASIQYQRFPAIRQFGLAAPGNAHGGINVIVQKKGLQPSSGVWIICGHYDTVPESPGADDNATGVAVMIELLSQIAPLQLTKDIWFVAFDLEEEGLLGSKYFVAHFSEKDNGPIVGVINLDMIGYVSDRPNAQYIPDGFDKLFPGIVQAVSGDENRADFALMVANETADGWLFKLDNHLTVAAPGLRSAMMIVPQSGNEVTPLRQSDHAVFWDAGYPAIFIGDGAGTRNPHYHSAKDKLEDVSVEHMAKINRSLYSFVRDAAIMVDK